MRIGLGGWAGRSQVERVEFYTRSSLYVVCWFLLGAAALGGVNNATTPLPIAGILVGTLVLGAAATAALRVAMDLYPDHAPLPMMRLVVLVALALAAEGAVFLLPEKAQFSGSLVVLAAVAWGAGGFRDKRLLTAVYVVSPVLPWLPTGHLGLAAYGLAMGLFLVFTVQTSLWLLNVVTELDRARGSQAALAVAEERLRFSRDVHDVLGRRLSTIAVQAELAATLTERGDPRAPERILQVRETAHEALREARQLAHGYRPLDLPTEVDGAVSLLRSAGIEATADLGGLPEEWHEPMARVIREAVTNVLRHSRATRVSMTYAADEVLITNDGVGPTPSTGDGATSGSGLRTLAEHLAPLGAGLTTGHEGDRFVVRAQLVGEPARPSATAEAER